MKRKKIMLANVGVPMAVASMFAMGQPVLADQRMERPASERQSSSLQQVAGEVIAMKQVRVPENDRTATLVLIQTDDGERAIVDLGATNDPELQQADVGLGERIVARGRLVSRDGRTFMIAEQLRADGQSFDIARQDRRDHAAREMPARERSDRASRDSKRWKDSAQWETIHPDISSASSSYGGTQSERNASGVPFPEGSPFSGTVSMGRAHPVSVVKDAQHALIQRGYNPGPIDGSMDEATREALKEFQRDSNLEVTGTLNAATARNLGVETAVTDEQR